MDKTSLGDRMKEYENKFSKKKVVINNDERQLRRSHESV
jgi:hypothetical protein